MSVIFRKDVYLFKRSHASILFIWNKEIQAKSEE